LSYYFHDVDILLINTRMDGWVEHSRDSMRKLVLTNLQHKQVLSMLEDVLAESCYITVMNELFRIKKNTFSRNPRYKHFLF